MTYPPAAEVGGRRVGSRLEFDGWVAARGPSLLRLAYLLTSDAREAEDLVEDALSRALARWARISRSQDPDAAVRRLLLAIHTSRWRRFVGRHTSRANVPDMPTSELGLEMGIELRDAVWDACSSLSVDQRTALVLHFHEELSVTQVADLTGDSESNVRSLLAGGLASLRTEVAER